jgi:hypothetical protein
MTRPVPAPSRRAAAALAGGAGIAVVALVALAGAIALAPPTPPSLPPVGSPATPEIRPTPTPQPTRVVVDVPAATDGSDATELLQAALDAAPDGAIIRLAAGGKYRIARGLVLEDRSGLELDGREATIELVASDQSHRRNLWLINSTAISIHDLALVGANPSPGVLDETRQFEHGIWVDGGDRIVIDRVSITNPWGDCVYLGDRDGRLPWVDGLVVRDSTCRGAGRNGIAIVAGRNVQIEGNAFGDIGLHAVDIEPNRRESGPVQGAERVTVTGNRVDGPVADYFFAANGWGSVSDLTVTDNVLAGVPLRITVKPLPGSGYVRRAVRIADNRSDTAFDGAGTAALNFSDVIGLTVTGNVVPLTGGEAPLIQVDRSCQVTIQGNRYPGGRVEWQGSLGPCPVEDPR